MVLIFKNCTSDEPVQWLKGWTAVPKDVISDTKYIELSGDELSLANDLFEQFIPNIDLKKDTVTLFGDIAKTVLANLPTGYGK